MKTTLSLFLLLILASALAQDVQTSLKIDKDEALYDRAFLNDHGLVFKLGHFGKKSQRLLHYSADGQLLWTTQIEDQYNLRNSKSTILASPNGPIVYYLELKDDGFPDKTQYVTRVTRDGKDQRFEIDGKGGHFGKSLQTVFCDDSFLYYLATEKGNERHDSKKSAEKLIMTRIAHTDVSPEKIVLALPSLAEGENTTFWTFAGQNGTEKYFVSKTIDTQGPRQFFEIAVINSDGQLLRKQSMEVALEGVFPRPAKQVKPLNDGVFQNADLNFDELFVPTAHPTGSAASSSFSTPGHARQSANSGAFSHVSYDQRTGSFYVYGLFGPKAYKKLGPVHEGFFVYKFDARGQNLWKLQYKGVKDLMSENFFRIHGAASDRITSLRILPDGKLNFSIHFSRTLFSYEISADGKIITSRKKNKYDDPSDNQIISTQPPLKSNAYMKSKSVEGRNYLSSHGELLVVYDDDNSEFDLVFWRNQAESSAAP